jgi:hypothetical protein
MTKKIKQMNLNQNRGNQQSNTEERLGYSANAVISGMAFSAYRIEVSERIVSHKQTETSGLEIKPEAK